MRLRNYIIHCYFTAAAAAAMAFLLPKYTGVSDVYASAVLVPKAEGITTYGNSKATIDASHTSDGYIMIRYQGSNPKVKIRITKDTEYTYDLNSSGNYETFPLSEGSGTYQVKVYEHVSGNAYALAANELITVTLSSETIPFLYPNQFVSFTADSAVVSMADTLTEGITDPLQKLNAIYHYTITNITYDTPKAESVQSGYLPDVDAVLASKTGICFDYAALMTAMLRSQEIPTKLVIGYAGDVYHAWVSIYVDEQGWIENIVYFDGTNWTLMDPTFAAGTNSYAANPTSYQGKFTY